MDWELLPPAMRPAKSAEIEHAVDNSRKGVQISQEVKSSLEEIVRRIGKTTNLVCDITSAFNEQAQGVDQINIANSQMDKVT